MKFKSILMTGLLLLTFAFSAAAQERRIDFTQTTSVNVGSVPQAQQPYVSVVHKGNGVVNQTVFTLTALPITVRDTEQGGGIQIFDFPEGRMFILGSTGSCTFTTTSVIASTLNSGVSSRWGIGTVTQSQTTLATTEQDLLPVTTFTSGTTISVANTATTGALAAAAQFNGTATPIDAFFNISVPTATDIDANATVTVSGTITITYINLGDF
jgi:hypothetical protein